MRFKSAVWTSLARSGGRIERFKIRNERQGCYQIEIEDRHLAVIHREASDKIVRQLIRTAMSKESAQRRGNSCLTRRPDGMATHAFFARDFLARQSEIVRILPSERRWVWGNLDDRPRQEVAAREH